MAKRFLRSINVLVYHFILKIRTVSTKVLARCEQAFGSLKQGEGEQNHPNISKCLFTFR